ncbi:hypothetical protein Rhopal_005377-T1 [Rhodotorula paludigena]|uniref:RRM domain-containing protein n=1 Tax=Rhodotorula paludigena TaxID=86838 RepID=A0AAV5GTI8_9BASI|nr:hypothetical protein Rhopal_005377-T1 [Rhodotorula paludigena]
MAPAAPLSTAPTTKRIHVGGLAPSVSPKDLVQRFSSFGSVVGGAAGVEGLGTTETGLPRSFAFFSLETTDAKFAKCMSTLNGSMWKAHKLRIALAKPDWATQRAAEREEAAKAADPTAPRPKKRKRASKDPNVGLAASHFELITPDNIQRHRGWVLDPKPAPAPLFPLILRPSHPVEQPEKPAATAWTRGKARAKPSKAAREALRAGVPLDKPALRRAKRMRIDPRRWGRKRVVFDLLTSRGARGDGAEGANMLSVGTWECEEPAEGAQHADDEVTWVFKTRDGQVRRRETVRLTQRSRPHTDRFTTLLEGLNRHDGLPAPVPEASSSSGVIDTPVVAAPATRSRSPSPPPYVPAAPRNLIYNEEDAFQLMATALDDSERAAAHRMERAEYRKIALGALEELGREEEDDDEEELAARQDRTTASDGRPLPRVEGFANDDDDDSDLFATLRIRGGGGVDSDSSDDDEDTSETVQQESSGSESSSDDSSSDSSSSDDEDATMSSAPAAAPSAKASLKDTLTTLFKPGAATTADTADDAEQGGFSLFGGMDLDLEPLERTPSPPPAAFAAPSLAPATAPSSRFVAPSARDAGYRGGAARPAFSGPSKPFFAFPSGAFEDRLRPGEVDESEVAKLGIEQSRIEAAKAQSALRVAEATKDFWQHETQEQIDEEHQKLRELLRGFARKRHREAVKRSKKTAGRRNAGLKLDVLDDD